MKTAHIKVNNSPICQHTYPAMRERFKKAGHKFQCTFNSITAAKRVAKSLSYAYGINNPQPFKVITGHCTNH